MKRIIIQKLSKSALLGELFFCCFILKETRLILAFEKEALSNSRRGGAVGVAKTNNVQTNMNRVFDFAACT